MERVLSWPGAFSAEECRQLAGRIPWPTVVDARGRGYSCVLEQPAFAQELGLLCGMRMPGVFVSAWGTQLTLSVDQRIGWHVDPALGATHKLCLYLDDAGPRAGLVFRDARMNVEGAQGTIVLFDISLEHRADDGGDRSLRRRVVGLRATVGG